MTLSYNMHKITLLHDETPYLVAKDFKTAFWTASSTWFYDIVLLNLYVSFKSASLYHTSRLIRKLSCVIGKLKKVCVCLEHLPSFLLLRWKLCIQILAPPPCPSLRIEMNQDNPSSAVWKPTQNSHMGLWASFKSSLTFLWQCQIWDWRSS